MSGRGAVSTMVDASKGDSMSMHMMAGGTHAIAVVPPVEPEPTEDAPVLALPRLLPVPAKKSCKNFALSRPRQRRTNKALSRKPKQLQLNKPERRNWTSSSNG